MTARALLASLGIATGGLLAAVAPAPAVAQVQDRIIDIYGDDKCPASNGQEIVVCRPHPEGERFRIPRDLRESEAPPTPSANAVAAVRSTGGSAAQIQSCNSIGGGVNAGCLKQQTDAWRAQKRADKAAEGDIP